MNLGGKQDLDTLLRSWPASPPKGVEAGQSEEHGWEARAEAIVRAATAAQSAGKEAAEALFAAPALAAEAGEDAAITAAGEKKMSNEKEPATSEPTATPAPAPAERKRQSLKEIAARASQSGQRLSQPGTPPPPSVAPPAAKPAAATPLPRPAEASKDDSGVINLQTVHDSATAQQRADAEKAKPAQAGLFEDDKQEDAAAAPAQKAAAAKPSNVTPIQAKRSNTGVIGGIAIAVIGLAAAFAIVSRKPPAAPPAPVAEVKVTPPAQTAAATPAPAPASAEPAPVASAEPAPSASAEAKVAEAPKAGGPLPSGAATAGQASAAPSGDARVAAKAPTPSGKPGDLQSEMEKAVGKDGAAKQDQPAAPDPVPASDRPKNIPEQPSQGAVAAALGPVMGGAKACVAGADDVSRASVTFSSAGNVTSVSVSGWAAAHGKSGCVQAALKGAKVGPFSKPSFTVGVPIRP